MKRFAGLLIVLAGCFWGVMGVFVRTFTDLGFTTMQIAALRLLVAAGLMVLLLAVTNPKRLKIHLKDFPLLAVLGIVSIGLMGVLYFTTIQLSSLSVAAVLLYLSPAAVLLMSALVFKETITPLKLVALALAVSGCALVSGIVGGGSVG
ncbi:MAG: EamA family transporter, partial [Clostridia bacterium]|nr:EamA family transporter [Clostridia bacterium]